MATERNSTPGKHNATIRNATDFWRYDSTTGFDLTRGGDEAITMQTNHKPVTIDAAKSALIIVDMQNFFLSTAFGRDLQGAGHKACRQLLTHAIPAARKAGIRIIWMNWGLTEKDLDEMPVAILRAWGFDIVTTNAGGTGLADRHGEVRLIEEADPSSSAYRGLGKPCGILHDTQQGRDVDAGLLMMRDQWNTALYAPLDREWQRGRQLASRPDVWVHKNRLSGLWSERTECEAVLKQHGIRTLLFAGVNTDQCVSGTLTDAYSKGYDTIMLYDGCGTTSPEFGQACIAYNAGRTWGFCCSCEQFADGVANMST